MYGEWRYISTILDLGIRWRWIISFILWPLCPQGKRPQYPLNKLSGPQNQSRRYGEEKNLATAGNWNPAVQPLTRPHTDWAIPKWSYYRGRKKERERSKAIPVTGRGRLLGLWDVKDPTFSSQSPHRWRWGCEPHTSSAHYPQEDSWYSFLLEAESNPVP
jgi:hypothetical protein